MTVVQSVTADELRQVIFGKDAKASAPNAATVAATPTPGAVASGARVWYDKTGSFSVEAVLLQVTDKEVILRKADGKKVVVPIANLSEADKRYLRE